MGGKVKLLLDHAGMVRLTFGRETSDHGRYYLADAPTRAIVVFDNGLNPEALTGAVVDAESGLEMGLAGYVRSCNVDLPHSKIAIHQRVDGPPDNRLSRLLAAGLQDEP
jgi:hypothetical protein